MLRVLKNSPTVFHALKQVKRKHLSWALPDFCWASEPHAMTIQLRRVYLSPWCLKILQRRQVHLQKTALKTSKDPMFSIVSLSVWVWHHWQENSAPAGPAAPAPCRSSRTIQAQNLTAAESAVRVSRKQKWIKLQMPDSCLPPRMPQYVWGWFLSWDRMASMLGCHLRVHRVIFGRCC